MKTILCATDFSQHASNAVKYSASLAEALKSKLFLVHAYEIPSLYNEQSSASVSFEDEQVMQFAEQKLNSIRTKLEKDHPALEIKTILLQGSPDAQFAEMSRKQDVDMMVLGTTITSPIKRLLAASTTNHILSEAGCPVLCIPKEARFRGINKIIFCTDLNEDNLNAAASLVTFSKKLDAEIIFLYVDNKHVIHSDETIAEMTSRIRSHISYPKISGYISKNPNISEGITFFLKKKEADLLVMLTHKKHFPETLIHPSVTKVMSHEAKIPLLSMKLSDMPILSAV